MKKLLLTAGLILGISYSAFSQGNDFKDRVFERVDRERKFDKCCFPEYCIKSEKSGNNDEYIIASYDFNMDGKIDLKACIKPGSSNNKFKCFPENTKDLAEIVMMDYDNDGNFDSVYSDLDQNGSLENKDIFYEPPKTKYWI